MKIYVASKYQERVHIKWLMRLLREAGHEITVDWTDHELYPADSPIRKMAEFALVDVKGVQECDVFIGVFLVKHHYRGALVEFGIALGGNKPCLILGTAEDDCIFMNHRLVVKVKDFDELISTLKEDRYVEI